MPGPFEREVKLRFESPDAARAAVAAAEAVPLRPRRLQRDCLLDTDEGALQKQRSALRVRTEGDTTLLTLKGPVLPGRVKTREELETAVANGSILMSLLEALGFIVWFRYEKYREEFMLDGAVVAVDETPVGTFVEIEGTEHDIAAAAERLGRSSGDYVLASYRRLFVEHCERFGLSATHMLFDHV